jgi:hypothetical protein
MKLGTGSPIAGPVGNSASGLRRGGSPAEPGPSKPNSSRPLSVIIVVLRFLDLSADRLPLHEFIQNITRFQTDGLIRIDTS